MPVDKGRRDALAYAYHQLEVLARQVEMAMGAENCFCQDID